MEQVTPQLEESNDKKLRNALERLLDKSYIIEDKEQALELIARFVERKRYELRSAKRNSPPGWIYKGGHTGFYRDVDKKYKWYKPGKPRPKDSRQSVLF